MKKLASLAAAALVLASCGKEAVVQPPAPAAAPAAAAAPQRVNLLAMTQGATVIDRTDELMLQNGAPAAIDDDPGSFYSTPRGDFDQSLTIELPARTRLTAVGAGTSPKKPAATTKVSFDTSLDGKTFTPLGTKELEAKLDAQWLELKSPVEASFIRLNIEEGGTSYGMIGDVTAAGTLLAPRHRTDITGCWSLNTAPGRVEQKGANVTGIFSPALAITGGANANLYRVIWLDGPMYGLGAFTVDSTSRRLSGSLWHERAEPVTVGEHWMGQRTDACDAPEGELRYDAIVATFLKRAGFFPFYGIVFDANDALLAQESVVELDLLSRMISTGQTLTVESYEFRHDSPEENRARSAARLKVLQQELARRGVNVTRITFAAKGSENLPQNSKTPLNKAMYSTITVRVAGSGF